MKNSIAFLVCALLYQSSIAQFAPPAGQVGTTAIYADSSIYISWATGCTVTKGYENVANPGLGYASAGDSSMALGVADGSTVSLGDGGSAIVTFANPIADGPGWDFAVFENSFDGLFLELGFVEVSSDGVNYYRFPATSYTQDTVQIAAFGDLDATKINNLAGKYKVLYGTPFDLQELSGQSGLDITHITHVKIIDVVGCIQDQYATHDQYGNKVNDPWPTPFPTCGFDLDAVGVINQVAAGVPEEMNTVAHLRVFPNPVKNTFEIQYSLIKNSDSFITITDVMGRIVYQEVKQNQRTGWQVITISGLNLNDGIYILNVSADGGTAIQKIMVANE